MRTAKAFGESQMSGRIETSAQRVVLSHSLYLDLVDGTSRQPTLCVQNNDRSRVDDDDNT